MDSLREVLHKLFETVNLHRSTHDDEHVRFLVNVSHLNGTDLLAQRMRLIVQNDSWSKRANANGSR